MRNVHVYPTEYSIVRIQQKNITKKPEAAWRTTFICPLPLTVYRITISCHCTLEEWNKNGKLLFRRHIWKFEASTIPLSSREPSYTNKHFSRCWTKLWRLSETHHDTATVERDFTIQYYSLVGRWPSQSSYPGNSWEWDETCHSLKCGTAEAWHEASPNSSRSSSKLETRWSGCVYIIKSFHRHDRIMHESYQTTPILLDPDGRFTLMLISQVESYLSCGQLHVLPQWNW